MSFRALNEAFRLAEKQNAMLKQAVEEMEERRRIAAGEPKIAGFPTRADLIWLCRNPGHSLAMVEINGVFVSMIVNEASEGPIIAEPAK